MLYLACYDIEDDTLRLKIANSLLAFGLERLQRSVFIGSLDESQNHQLLKEINRWLASANLATTQFLMMPLAEAYTRKTYWFGEEPPDWSYHCNQTLTLIV